MGCHIPVRGKAEPLKTAKEDPTISLCGMMTPGGHLLVEQFGWRGWRRQQSLPRRHSDASVSVA